tara:strand:- start:95 stop:493 length:399 start_codon:yes stop_codon:yes gene_type:complete
MTGLLNETCPECDSTDLLVVEIEPEAGEPSWTVTARRTVNDADEGFQWESTLQANIKEFTTWLDGHDLEYIHVSEDGEEKAKTGCMTVYWIFPVVDALRAVELVSRLTALRPGLMENVQIEVDYHDSVEVEV